ncbi:hypothetical protein DEV91_106113 [Phyllobacterium brassicacearum]|nr:hypothetical protein DEV91_106113 [Phyllobacterium brassicacearum]
MQMTLPLYLPTTIVAIGFGVAAYRFVERPVTVYLSASLAGVLARKSAVRKVLRPSHPMNRI